MLLSVLPHGAMGMATAQDLQGVLAGRPARAYGVAGLPVSPNRRC